MEKKDNVCKVCNGTGKYQELMNYFEFHYIGDEPIFIDLPCEYCDSPENGVDLD